MKKIIKSLALSIVLLNSIFALSVHPNLNEDDFLDAHWEKQKDEYPLFLLEEQQHIRHAIELDQYGNDGNNGPCYFNISL